MTEQDKKVQEARERFVEKNPFPEYIIVDADRYEQYVEEQCDGIDPFPDKKLVLVPEDRMLK